MYVYPINLPSRALFILLFYLRLLNIQHKDPRDRQNSWQLCSRWNVIGEGGRYFTCLHRNGVATPIRDAAVRETQPQHFSKATPFSQTLILPKKFWVFDDASAIGDHCFPLSVSCVKTHRRSGNCYL